MTTNVIDLQKGAAVGSALSVTILVMTAFYRGLSHAVSWVLLATAVLLVPVAWRCWRLLMEEPDSGPGIRERRAALPPFDQPEGPEPQSNVKRLE